MVVGRSRSFSVVRGGFSQVQRLCENVKVSFVIEGLKKTLNSTHGRDSMKKPESISHELDWAAVLD